MALKGQLLSNTASGSTYVRWGRTSCPTNGTNLLYKGFMAGQHYGRKGGAADGICLTQEPTWGEYNDNKNTNGALIFGTEYEFTDTHGPLNSMNLYRHDVPCAVCHSHRSATLMIPGRDQCYSGWMLAYSGYLVSGRQEETFDPSYTNYVCLDKQPETEFGEHRRRSPCCTC